MPVYCIGMSLSPSQRVSLIKEIGQRLKKEGWDLIDITLKQFSLPISNQFSGSSEAYILRMIEDAPDEPLIDLAQYLGFDLEIPARSALEPSFWRKGMFRLFVSHLSSHKVWAADLQERLIQFGISAFVAHNDIEPTREWQTQIETALATCDSLVALLHDGFHKSNWTDQEIGFAMGRGVPVFSVRFGETPYGFIGRFQAFNGNNIASEGVADQLFDAYRKNKETKRRMAGVLVTLFEESDSFANAKRRIGYLEDLDFWERSFSMRIQTALESNSQIREAFGVPQRVKNLVEKWSRQ